MSQANEMSEKRSVTKRHEAHSWHLDPRSGDWACTECDLILTREDLEDYELTNCVFPTLTAAATDYEKLVSKILEEESK